MYAAAVMYTPPRAESEVLDEIYMLLEKLSNLAPSVDHSVRRAINDARTAFDVGDTMTIPRGIRFAEAVALSALWANGCSHHDMPSSELAEELKKATRLILMRFTRKTHYLTRSWRGSLVMTNEECQSFYLQVCRWQLGPECPVSDALEARLKHSYERDEDIRMQGRLFESKTSLGGRKREKKQKELAHSGPVVEPMPESARQALSAMQWLEPSTSET